MDEIGVHTIRTDDATWKRFVELTTLTGLRQGAALRELLRLAEPEMVLGVMRGGAGLASDQAGQNEAVGELLAQRLITEAGNIRGLMDRVVKQVPDAERPLRVEGVPEGHDFNVWARQTIRTLEASTTTSALTDGVLRRHAGEE